MRQALPALAATLLLAAGAGCGGDNDDEAGGDTSPPAATTTTAPPAESTDPTATRPEPAPTQSRWAAQVDAVCRPIQEQIDAVPPPADAAGLERALEQTLPLVRKQLAKIKAIEPPAKKDEAEVATLFVGSLQRLEAALTRYLAAIRAGDATDAEAALSAAGVAGAEARSFAASLGVTECGGYSTG